MDNHEELERLENEIFHAREAIEHMECVNDCEDIIEIINGRIDGLTEERNRVHASIEAQDDAEQDALLEEYWRDAM